MELFALDNKKNCEGLPDGPEMKASPPNAGSVGLIPCWGAKILHASGKKIQT